METTTVAMSRDNIQIYGSYWRVVLALWNVSLGFRQVVFVAESLCGRHEKRLLNELLSSYNTLERPVANESEPLEVRFGITLQQIIDVVSYSPDATAPTSLIIRCSTSTIYKELNCRSSFERTTSFLIFKSDNIAKCLLLNLQNQN